MRNIRIKKVNLEGLIEMLEFVKSSVDAEFVDLICNNEGDQDMIVIAVEDAYLRNDNSELEDKLEDELENKLETNKLSDEDINNLINE